MPTQHTTEDCKPADRMPYAHLSEDQLDELLLEEGTAEERAHLAQCALCGSRMAAFESALASFNQASLAWAEAKSNTISRDIMQAVPRHTRVATGTALRWSAVAAAALVLVAGVGRYQGEIATFHRVSPAQTATLATPAVADAQANPQLAQIAQDNEMLRQIDQALNGAVASPDAEYPHTADMASPVRN